MNHYERIIAVFERRPVDKIPLNIRHEYWYHVAKASGKLPQKYRGMGLVDICRDVGASWRCYSGYFVKSAVEVEYGDDIKFIADRSEGLVKTTIKTPVGSINEVSKQDEWGLSSRRLEYLVKNADDFKILEHVLDGAKVKFNMQVYEELERNLKGQGIVTFFFPHSALQALILDYVGFVRTMRFLFIEKPQGLEGLMEAIERYNGKFFEAVAFSPIKILNLGENIDVRLTSPKLFEKFCIPIYQKRCDYLHKRGKYVHMHVDGYAKPLLPLLRQAGLDGVEALTPEPIGDMTIDDIAREIRDELVVLDGIPYLLFLPEVPYEVLENFVRKIVKKIPRLVLGISDELPPPGDIGRVRKVSKLLEEIG